MFYIFIEELVPLDCPVSIFLTWPVSAHSLLSVVDLVSMAYRPPEPAQISAGSLIRVFSSEKKTKKVGTMLLGAILTSFWFAVEFEFHL
jgi:hypothetical protein